MGKTIILVDQSWLLHRFYYTNSSMQVCVEGKTYMTGAIYGFTNLVAETVTAYGRDVEIIFCKDDGTKTRKKISQDYKRHREEKPQVYAPLKDVIKVLSCLKGNVKFAYSAGQEADDVIAYLAYRFKEVLTDEDDIIVYTGDRDMWQLIPDGIKISKERKRKKFLYVTRDDVFMHKEFKVKPEVLLRFRTLSGDSSDGISAVVPRMKK